jgi:hypothetical protein
VTLAPGQTVRHYRLIEKIGGGGAAPRFTNYDAAPDGSRFVMVQGGDPPVADHLAIVLDWFQELERPVPAAGD